MASTIPSTSATSGTAKTSTMTTSPIMALLHELELRISRCTPDRTNRLQARLHFLGGQAVKLTRLATLRAVHEHLQLLAEELHRTVARLEIIALAGQMHVLDQLVEHPLAGENELIDSARLRCDMRLLHQLLVSPLERALLFIYGTSLASLRLISSGAMIPMPL